MEHEIQNIFNDSRTYVYKIQTIDDVIKNAIKICGNDESFYVCDLGKVVRRYENFCKVMPRVHPFYAVKCNDHTPILKTLAGLGAGFDCASEFELSKIVTLFPNINRSQIIIANPAKPPSLIRCSEKLGVSLTTYDNACDLSQVRKNNPNAKLVLRIRYDASRSLVSFGEKYGCDIEEGKKLLLLTKQMGMDVVGVSFHVGTYCEEPEAYYQAILLAKRVFDYAETIGIHMDLLDIGGGFSGNTIDSIARCVNQALEELFPKSSNIKIIAEPGRYMVESSSTLVSHVYNVKEFEFEDGIKNNARFGYILSDGAFGSFLHIVKMQYQSVKPRLLNSVPEDEPSYLSILWGPTCASYDIINPLVELPRLYVGDCLLFDKMGAYTRSGCSTFNGFQVPKVFNICTNEIKKCLLSFGNIFDEDNFKDFLMLNQLYFNTCVSPK